MTCYLRVHRRIEYDIIITQHNKLCTCSKAYKIISASVGL